MSVELNVAYAFWQAYDQYYETSLTHRRFKHRDILPLIEKLRERPDFTVTKTGDSFEGRAVHLIKFGTGKKRVMLWSQMHGDEAVATAALFDFMNFVREPGQMHEFRDHLLKDITFYVMPMVNPDGTERYQRRNAQQIDLNRDAQRLEAPESRLLMDTFKQVKPHFGFNMHDQTHRYGAGNTFLTAALSFLAPPYNEKRETGEPRRSAMHLIGKMFIILSRFIPEHIGRYTDELEERSFGDTFQSMGSSILLIESGGWKGDAERQYVRKLNVLAIAAAFYSICLDTYRHIPLDVYGSIPLNEKNIFDLLLRNVSIVHNGIITRLDIGINREEHNTADAAGYFLAGTVEDMGDLSPFYGIEELDCTGLTAEQGRVYESTLENIEELEKLDPGELHASGFTHVTLRRVPDYQLFSSSPVNIIEEGGTGNSAAALPEAGSAANLVLRGKDGKVQHIVINGFLTIPGRDCRSVPNGRVIRQGNGNSVI